MERWGQSLQQEYLNWFIMFGKKHFNILISEYVEHYHTERPHQGMGNVPLVGELDLHGTVEPDLIVCRTRLGGVLRHYEKHAA